MGDLDEIRQWLDNPARPRCDLQTEAYITYLLYALKQERDRHGLLKTQFDELSQSAEKIVSKEVLMNENNNYVVATVPDEPEVKPQYFSGQDEWLTILFIPNWRQATPMTEPQAVQLAQDLEAMFSLRRKKFQVVCLDDLVQGENEMNKPLNAPKCVEVYYDAEFTGLHQNTTPISMGFVAETGETFYAEFTDYDESQVNSWIQENVLDKRILCHTNGGNGTDLHGFVGDRTFVKEKLESWLSQFDQVQIVSDVAHYDFVLFIQLWGHAFNLPKHVSPTCHDINQDIAGFLGISEAEAFDINREKFCGLVAGEGDKHNALWDAKVIKACRHKMLLPRKVEYSEIKVTSYDDDLAQGATFNELP